MSALLSCTALQKSLGGRRLFDGLTLTLSRGDRVGLIGPNGSGKTTLLQILAGEERPDGGTSALRKGSRLAYVPQDSLFGPEDTVESVLRAALAGQPLDEDEKRGTVQATLGRAGFESGDALAVKLSGGWKKRLAIAAALAQSPDVMLLDEPTNHLDLAHQIDLLATVRDLGLTVVAALHDLDLAAAFCDHVVVLRAGEVVASGTPSEVLTAALVDDVYGVEATVGPHPEFGRLHVVWHDERAVRDGHQVDGDVR